MSGKPQKCPMRHENGNCVPCGGFCLAVQPLICEALQNAFDMGMRDGISVTMRAKSLVVQKHGRWLDGRCTNCTFEAEEFFDYEGRLIVYTTDYCPNCGAKMDGET